MNVSKINVKCVFISKIGITSLQSYKIEIFRASELDRETNTLINAKEERQAAI